MRCLSMSIGLILLVIVGILVLCGVAQRVLDKLRLTDRQALLFVALLLVADGFRISRWAIWCG